MQQWRPPQAVECAVGLGPRGAPPRLAGRRAPDHLVRRPARPFALARRRQLPAGTARRGPQVGARGGRSPASGPSMRQTAPGVATVRRLPPLLLLRTRLPVRGLDAHAPVLRDSERDAERACVEAGEDARQRVAVQPLDGALLRRLAAVGARFCTHPAAPSTIRSVHRRPSTIRSVRRLCLARRSGVHGTFLNGRKQDNGDFSRIWKGRSSPVATCAPLRVSSAGSAAPRGEESRANEKNRPEKATSKFSV